MASIPSKIYNFVGENKGTLALGALGLVAAAVGAVTLAVIFAHPGWLSQCKFLAHLTAYGGTALAAFGLVLMIVPSMVNYCRSRKPVKKEPVPELPHSSVEKKQAEKPVEARKAPSQDTSFRAIAIPNLLHAAETGNLQVMEHFAAFIPEASALGETLLHIAAKHGHENIVNYLIEHGLDVNKQDFIGETPLHKAEKTGRTSIVSTLLSKGAQIDIRNSKGLTPLQIAKKWDHKSVEKFLLLQGATLETSCN